MQKLPERCREIFLLSRIEGLKYKEIAFNVDGQVKNINGRIVEIAFVNVDKLTSTVMLFLSMFSENL